MITDARTLPDTEPAAGHMIADHFDNFFRTVLAPGDALNTPISFRYITREPHPFGNLLVISRDATPADVTRDAAALCDDGFPSAIVFLDAATAEQLAAASDLGFAPAESMPLMSVTRSTLASTKLPDGYTSREVTVEETDAWSRAVAEGYGLPLPVGALFSVDQAAARAPGRARYFVAEHDGRMVATSLVYMHDGLAGIYGVSTVPEHRGKGLGAHLTAQPLRDAWDEGYTTGVLQASEMGAPVYTRIGFKTHGHLALVARMPG